MLADVIWVSLRQRTLGRGAWAVKLPGGRLTLLQIAIGIVDLTFCSAAMYMLVPQAPAIGFITVAVVFISATLLGFASHAPGGLGVFDAAMLVGLWQMKKANCSRRCCCFVFSTTSSRLYLRLACLRCANWY